MVISAGDSSIPVTIEGNSGKALPVGVQIQRGNITLKNVNVGADEADLLADVNGTKAGIAVYVTADNQALKNVTLDNCNVVLSGDFGTSPVDGIHVFGDASQAATGSVKNCAITLTDVTSQDNKINGIELGAPDVEVTDNTIKGATRGIYASWVGADDEINISGNIVNLRETEFVNSAEYFIWYTGEAAPADFGTANSTAIPEKVAEWLEAGELENGQSVIVCYSDASALEKYEQSKDGQTSYYYDAEAAEGDGAWVDMAETPDVEEPGTGEEEGGEAPAPTPGEGE